MENKLFTKDQIKNAIWQELKEAEYTGDNNDRSYEVIGIVMAGLKKITPINAPTGSHWVKASERLPGLKTPVKWRQGEVEMKVKAVWYMILDTNSQYLSQCEWLDEQPVAGREEDIAEQDRKDGKELSAHYAHIEACEKKEAEAFGDWLATERWQPRINTEWARYETIYSDVSVKTTTELYNLFKKDNP